MGRKERRKREEGEGKETVRERRHFLPAYLFPQTSASAGAGPGQCQVTETPSGSPAWMARTYVLGPSSAGFLGAFADSFIRNAAPGSSTSTTIGIQVS